MVVNETMDYNSLFLSSTLVIKGMILYSQTGWHLMSIKNKFHCAFISHNSPISIVHNNNHKKKDIRP